MLRLVPMASTFHLLPLVLSLLLRSHPTTAANTAANAAASVAGGAAAPTLQAVVQPGTTIRCHPCASGALAFRPVGSLATVSAEGLFTADVLGDYVPLPLPTSTTSTTSTTRTTSTTSTTTLATPPQPPQPPPPQFWRAIELPPTGGVSPPDRFSDGFRRPLTAQPSPAASAGSASFDTDTRLGGWRVAEASAAGCVDIDTANRGLVLTTAAAAASIKGTNGGWGEGINDETTSGATSPVSSSCAVETDDTMPLPSMFSEPLTLTLTGVTTGVAGGFGKAGLVTRGGARTSSSTSFPASPASPASPVSPVMRVTFGGLTLEVNHTLRTATSATTTTTATHATVVSGDGRAIIASSVEDCPGTVGVTVILSVNSVNATMRLQCDGGDGGDGRDGGDGPLSSPLSPWNGRGVPHLTHCNDAGGMPTTSTTSTTSTTGSTSTTQTTAHTRIPTSTRTRRVRAESYKCASRGGLRIEALGGGVSLRSVSLRSCLVAGNDPLRPTVMSLPVYPAVLDGITDEVGFTSPDLGAAQPRAAEGILDVRCVLLHMSV